MIADGELKIAAASALVPVFERVWQRRGRKRGDAEMSLGAAGKSACATKTLLEM